MKRKIKQDVPNTVGDLRHRLARLGNPWEADPRLGDDDPIPNRPRGGQPEEEIPDEHRLTPLGLETDLPRLIATEPPTNPFLRLRWAEAGLLPEEKVEGLSLEPGEGEGGTA